MSVYLCISTSTNATGNICLLRAISWSSSVLSFKTEDDDSADCSLSFALLKKIIGYNLQYYQDRWDSSSVT